MKKILVLAVLAVAVLAAMPASASCLPEKQFGQLGSDGTFTYTFFPADWVPGAARRPLLAGRQPGPRQRGSATGSPTGPTRYGSPTAPEPVLHEWVPRESATSSSAPPNAIIALVQAQTATGSAFVAWRSVEQFGPAVTFDLSLLVGRANVNAIEIPNPPGRGDREGRDGSHHERHGAPDRERLFSDSDSRPDGDPQRPPPDARLRHDPSVRRGCRLDVHRPDGSRHGRLAGVPSRSTAPPPPPTRTSSWRGRSASTAACSWATTSAARRRSAATRRWRIRSSRTSTRSPRSSLGFVEQHHSRRPRGKPRGLLF